MTNPPDSINMRTQIVMSFIAIIHFYHKTIQNLKLSDPSTKIDNYIKSRKNQRLNSAGKQM